MKQKIKLSLHKNPSVLSESYTQDASFVDGTLARAVVTSYKNNLKADPLKLFQARIQQLKENVNQLSFVLAEINEVLHQSSISFNESL